MATHYTLDIVNFWKNTAVYFFVEPPAVDPATSLYTNVWFQSPVTMMSGLSVRVLLRPYSWCGTAVHGRIPPGGDIHNVNIGTDNIPGSTFHAVEPKEEEVVTPVINLIAAAASAKKDCFQITSGTEFISPECRVGMAVGYSIRDRNVWYPSASIIASRDMNFNIMPKAKFYVAFGNPKKGTVIDFPAVQANAGVWDFTAAGTGGGYSLGEIKIIKGSFSETIYKPFLYDSEYKNAIEEI